MDVSNLLGHVLINPTSFNISQNLEVSQVYMPSLVTFSNENNSPTVTFILPPPPPQNDEEKSDSDDDSDNSEEEESENECNSKKDKNKNDLEAENQKGANQREKLKCIHRTRYSREEYRCETCRYACTTEKAFLKHVRQCIVTKDSDVSNSLLSCPVCGKDRRNELSLSTHMVKHKSGKYFCCDLCKFKSIQLKKIIQHRRMHTGEKPHLCPHCSYRSSRRDNLRSHVRRIHNEDDLHCDTFTPRKILLLPNTQNQSE